MLHTGLCCVKNYVAKASIGIWKTYILRNLYPQKMWKHMAGRCKANEWREHPSSIFFLYRFRVRSLNTNLCLDDLQQNNEKPYNLGVYACSKEISKTQFFSLTNNKVLRNELSCATVQHSDSPPFQIVMTSCFENDDHNEKWQYLGNRLRHIPTGLCLDHSGRHQGDFVQVAPCDSFSSKTQSWAIDHGDESYLPQ